MLLLLLSLSLALTACAMQEPDEQKQTGYAIYYLDIGLKRGGDAIRVSYEQLELAEDADLEQRAQAVVQRMLQGSREDGELVSPMPEYVQLLSLDVRDRRAYVDLSSGFDQLNGVDLMLADYCLVLSLTALEGIQSVAITAQGRTMMQQPKQIFFERDVRLMSMEDMMQTVEVTLYFQDEGGAMVGEPRTLEIYEGQTVAETLVMALQEGPENRGLKTVIPKEVTISSARVENGICYVNFAEESLKALPQEENQQQMILWSLADSLYSIETVEEIRILADGQELEMFGLIPAAVVAAKPQG